MKRLPTKMGIKRKLGKRPEVYSNNKAYSQMFNFYLQNRVFATPTGALSLTLIAPIADSFGHF